MFPKRRRSHGGLKPLLLKPFLREPLLLKPLLRLGLCVGGRPSQEKEMIVRGYAEDCAVALNAAEQAKVAPFKVTTFFVHIRARSLRAGDITGG
eukprot:9241621-Pyramimonas_sp.AAC.2